MPGGSMASIKEKGDLLYLVATLPMKDGSPGRKQYKIPLHLDASPQGQIKAKRRKVQLERSLEQEKFHWDDWLSPQGLTKNKPVTWRDAIDRLYEYRRYEKGMKQDQWEKKWLPLITKAPIRLANPCTADDMLAVMASWDPSQDTYMKAYRAFRKLAELAGIAFPQLLKPTYSLPHERGEAKEVPSDKEAIEWVQLADRGQPNGKALRWYFGMIATYGLRPHEIDHVTMLDDGKVQVPWVDSKGRKTKTGFRTVIPIPEDWIELFDLQNKVARPDSEEECYRWLRNSLRRHPFVKKEWTNYSLRHAFAGRLWRLGGTKLDTYTAARMMGHSRAVHEETYRHHIEPYEIANKAEEAIQANQADQQERLMRVKQPAG